MVSGSFNELLGRFMGYAILKTGMRVRNQPYFVSLKVIFYRLETIDVEQSYCMYCTAQGEHPKVPAYTLSEVPHLLPSQVPIEASRCVLLHGLITLLPLNDPHQDLDIHLSRYSY